MNPRAGRLPQTTRFYSNWRTDQVLTNDNESAGIPMGHVSDDGTAGVSDTQPPSSVARTAVNSSRRRVLADPSRRIFPHRSLAVTKEISQRARCCPAPGAHSLWIHTHEPVPPFTLRSTPVARLEPLPRTMNAHTTPRPFAMRSIAGASNQQPQQKQPPPPQVSSNEEYGAIADEDREHIDEVVSFLSTAA